MHPEYYTSGLLPLGNPDAPGEVDIIHATQKGKEILGVVYVGMNKIAEDTLAYFKAQGWLDKKYSRTEHKSNNMLVKWQASIVDPGRLCNIKNQNWFPRGYG